MIKVKIPANSSRYIFNDSHTTQYILIIEKKRNGNERKNI